MGVSCSLKNMELCHLEIAELVSAEHPAHRFRENLLRIFFEHAGVRNALDVAEVAAMGDVFLLFRLSPEEDDFLRIEHDHMVAMNEMRGEGGLMLAPDHMGDFCRKTTDVLICSIDKEPLRSLWFGNTCFHDFFFFGWESSGAMAE